MSLRPIDAIVAPQRPAHPFETWCAAMLRDGHTAFGPKDVKLTPGAAKQFALGIEPGGTPLLGVSASAAPALSSMPWTSAAMFAATAERDWVVLFAKDIRIESLPNEAPKPLYLWIPLARGVLACFKPAKAQELVLREVAPAKRGARVVPHRAPIATLPLARKGDWQGMAEISYSAASAMTDAPPRASR